MHDVRDRFAALADRPDDRIDLGEAALLIAAEAQPGLDVAHYLDELDKLADEARPELANFSGVDRILCLNAFLFVKKRFCGNKTVYEDPRNSFLNHVLDRRTGLPITLAVVYMEVARRLGLQVAGVGFPGHFLAKHVDETETIIDPFYGRILSESDCVERLHQVLGDDAAFDRRFLAATNNKEIIARMLRNLKHFYAAAREFTRALEYSDLILLLLPDEPVELRDRGLLYRKLECFGSAKRDLERFLELAGNDPSAGIIRSQLKHIRRLAARIH